MKKSKRTIFIIAICALTLAASVTVFAKGYQQNSSKPFDVPELAQSRATTGYCYLASQTENFEEFKAEMLQKKQAQLDLMLENKKITQEKYDELIADFKERQQGCDGTANENCPLNEGRIKKEPRECSIRKGRNRYYGCPTA